MSSPSPPQLLRCHLRSTPGQALGMEEDRGLPPQEWSAFGKGRGQW